MRDGGILRLQASRIRPTRMDGKKQGRNVLQGAETLPSLPFFLDRLIARECRDCHAAPFAFLLAFGVRASDRWRLSLFPQ